MRSGRGGGSRLPATRQRANELGISRNTVLAAYEQLRAEGFIDGRVGSGSYIAEQLPQIPRSPAPPQANVAPQSAFARRMRECPQPGRIPGGVAEGGVQVRERVVSGKSVAASVAVGCARIFEKKT